MSSIKPAAHGQSLSAFRRKSAAEIAKQKHTSTSGLAIPGLWIVQLKEGLTLSGTRVEHTGKVREWCRESKSTPKSQITWQVNNDRLEFYAYGGVFGADVLSKIRAELASPRGVIKALNPDFVMHNDATILQTSNRALALIAPASKLQGQKDLVWACPDTMGTGVRVYVIDVGFDSTDKEFKNRKGIFTHLSLSGGNHKDDPDHGNMVAKMVGGVSSGSAPSCDLVTVWSWADQVPDDIHLRYYVENPDLVKKELLGLLSRKFPRMVPREIVTHLARKYYDFPAEITDEVLYDKYQNSKKEGDEEGHKNDENNITSVQKSDKDNQFMIDLLEACESDPQGTMPEVLTKFPGLESVSMIIEHLDLVHRDIMRRAEVGSNTPNVITMSRAVARSHNETSILRCLVRTIAKVVPLIVSAGNNSKNLDTFERTPSDMEEVVTVGCLGNDLNIWEERRPEYKEGDSGSNTGKNVDIWAPAEEIQIESRTFDRETRMYTLTYTKTAESGTSLATPIVAGIVACMIADHVRKQPSVVFTSDTVKDILRSNAVEVNGLKMVTTNFGI